MTQHQAPEVTSELRECPFCGTGRSDDPNATQVQPYASQGAWMVICENCGVESGMHNTKAAAITAWNTRATQPLSLTVETKDVLRSAAFDVLDWLRDNREALLDRLQSLSLPVDIDRSGLAQEVDDISYAGLANEDQPK